MKISFTENKSELIKVFLTGLLLILSGFLFILYDWSVNHACQWLLQSIFFWCFVSYQAYSRLELNKLLPESPLYETLGWANRATMIRGGLIALTGGFIFIPAPSGYLQWLTAVFYTLAAIIDRLDGFIARRTCRESILGRDLDTIYDAFGLAIAPILAIWYGKVHWTYLLVSIAYYLFQWGIYYRRRHGLEIFELTQNLSRRAVAGFQMGFIAAALFPVFVPPSTVIAGVAFMIPVLAGFLIDWLHVSGRLDRDGGVFGKYQQRLASWSNRFLLPLMRALTVLLVIYLLAGTAQDSIEKAFSPVYLTLWFLAVCMTSLLILFGVMGIFSAIILVLLLGLHYAEHTFNIVDALLLCSVIGIMIFGTGRYSLCQQDAIWINRYDGA